MHIASVKALLNPNVMVCGQNMSQTGKGAYTGEISGEQLKDFDVNWILIGHSERRTLYGETDAMVASKVTQAQDVGLNAIVCVGETLEQREADATNDVLKTQLEGFKASVKDWSRVVVAYEPVWAIGTGKVASPEIAQECCEFIRNWLKENVSEEVAAATRI